MRRDSGGFVRCRGMDRDRLERLDRQALRLERFLRDLLVVVAVLVFVGAVVALLSMGGPTYGGRVFVAISAVFVLGWLDTQYDKVERRRLVGLEGAGERAVWRRMRLRLGLLGGVAIILLAIAVILG